MFNEIIANTSKIIISNADKIKLTLAAIFSEGSILIEDYPGSGKTTFAKAITQNLGLNFKRIQFTSDLLPSDILGFNILSDGKLNFQSAFLEAMEEKNVSIDGESYKLPEPFFVIATQNPMDSSGTSSLPDSQLDRFMISFSLSDLNENDKILMLKNTSKLNGASSKAVDWETIKQKKDQLTIKDEIYKYVVEIEQVIQTLDQKIYISARCLKQILDLAKGWAIIHEKDYVTHQDIKETLPYILRHRIKFLNQEDKMSFINEEILQKIKITNG
jgi:MoxR-like ATPase